MDPDEVYEVLKTSVIAWEQADTPDEEHDAAREFTSAFGALDDWIRHRGFLPRAWQTFMLPDTSEAWLNEAESLMRQAALAVEAARRAQVRELDRAVRHGS